MQTRAKGRWPRMAKTAPPISDQSDTIAAPFCRRDGRRPDASPRRRQAADAAPPLRCGRFAVTAPRAMRQWAIRGLAESSGPMRPELSARPRMQNARTARSGQASRERPRERRFARQSEAGLTASTVRAAPRVTPTPTPPRRASRLRPRRAPRPLWRLPGRRPAPCRAGRRRPCRRAPPRRGARDRRR